MHAVIDAPMQVEGLTIVYIRAALDSSFLSFGTPRTEHTVVGGGVRQSAHHRVNEDICGLISIQFNE